MRTTRWPLGTLILAAAALAPNAALAGGAPAPVPEPTGLALFAVGTAAVVVGLRLRKSR
ncbi:MAG TPA: PEP-CTERM sorting domain-containing protein [Myxococcota bacterium]|jgi:hypothetical protein|nr:PEP-CTERM sorting domain-containing protein [Myxococcota bacterium]